MKKKEGKLAVKGRKVHFRVWDVLHEIPGDTITPQSQVYQS